MKEIIFVIIIVAALIGISVWSWWLENGPESVQKKDKKDRNGESIK